MDFIDTLHSHLNQIVRIFTFSRRVNNDGVYIEGLLVQSSRTKKYYIFHNNSNAMGGRPSDKNSENYGYKYSWWLCDDCATSIENCDAESIEFIEQRIIGEL